MKTALVTGASRGIGRAIAVSLAKQGYNIALNYKQNEQAALEAEREILSHGVVCLRACCDVRNQAEVIKMHKLILQTLGHVSVVVNNAGVARGGLIQDVTEDDYDYIMDTNLKGAYNIAKVFSPHLIAAKDGRIINISSVWGQVGAAYESIYSASKAGIIGLTKSLAKELAPSGITVNSIAPGAIMTDMLKQLPSQTLDLLENDIPLGRIGTGEDIAAVVSYLVQECSKYITGQVINVSGGFVI